MLLTGKLDRRIDVLYRADSVNAETGETIPAWNLLKRLPAEKLSRGAAERLVGVELVSSTAVVWRIRYREDVKPDMRLNVRGQTYRISGIYEGNNGRFRELYLVSVTEEPER